MASLRAGQLAFVPRLPDLRQRTGSCHSALRPEPKQRVVKVRVEDFLEEPFLDVIRANGTQASQSFVDRAAANDFIHLQSRANSGRDARGPAGCGVVGAEPGGWPTITRSIGPSIPPNPPAAPPESPGTPRRSHLESPGTLRRFHLESPGIHRSAPEALEPQLSIHTTLGPSTCLRNGLHPRWRFWRRLTGPLARRGILADEPRGRPWLEGARTRLTLYTLRVRGGRQTVCIYPGARRTRSLRGRKHR